MYVCVYARVTYVFIYAYVCIKYTKYAEVQLRRYAFPVVPWINAFACAYKFHQ